MKLSTPVVIFGAGNLGRRVARAVSPDLFCDNNTKLWGTTINGILVESPAAAVKKYPEATFVVAIWSPSRTETMLDRIGTLKALGATRVIPFTDLIEDYADRMLPNLLWAESDYYGPHTDEIARGRALLDEAGREEFDRQMRLRLRDFSGQVIDPETQFFTADVRLDANAVFIDGGAFDGDTIASFCQATGDRYERIIAFEPDPKNRELLCKAISGEPRISVLPYGLGAHRETLRFTLAGAGSRVSQDGECEIEIVTLDETLNGVAPTYIKFDIEGSELDALEGGRRTIQRFRPNLAVCVYHVPDHLWRVPLKLHELVPDSRLTLRTHNADGFDCVCYCFPE